VTEGEAVCGDDVNSNTLELVLVSADGVAVVCVGDEVGVVALALLLESVEGAAVVADGADGVDAGAEVVATGAEVVATGAAIVALEPEASEEVAVVGPVNAFAVDSTVPVTVSTTELTRDSFIDPLRRS